MLSIFHPGSKLKLTNTLLLLVLLFPLPVFAEQIINKIQFIGNDTTSEHVMRLEMVVKEGDPVDVPKIKESVQNIMDLGLFERVDYALEQDAETGNTTLVITVIERYYFLPLPTAKLNSDNQLEYGAKLRWDNVAGWNHKLVWKVVDKGTKDSIKQYENTIQYTIPRIFSSRYQLGLHYQHNVIVDDDPDVGAELRSSSSYGVDLLKWLNGHGASRGPFAGGGINYVTQDISLLDSGTVPSENYYAVEYNFRLGVEDRHEYEFNRDGHYVQYRLDFSNDDQSGVDSTYQKHQLEYISYNSFNKNPPLNFNYRLLVGQSDHTVLGVKAFQLGGNDNLRGYRSGTYRGNAIVQGNFEYLSQLFSSPLLRKVIFFDTGTVPDSLGDLKLSDFKSGAGFGIRWKLRRFVNVDIRLDAAYAFETGDIRYGLGTHATF